jgi:putative membrane protein
MFGFRALWSPYFFSALLAATIIYFLLLVKFRAQFKNNEPLTRRQGTLFVTSVCLLYVIDGSPLNLLAHLMFFVHMTQMSILLLVIPPLFILSIPPWVWRNFLSIKVFRFPFFFFTKPLFALFLFNGLFSFYHIPFIFDHVMENMWLHSATSVLLFMSAIFMWWPLINELPDAQLSGLKKVGYIFADGILLTPACALIIFASTPMYATYSDPKAWSQMMGLSVGSSTVASLKMSGPEMFGLMSVLHDQQLGGVLMKIIQEIIYGSMLGRVFFEWYRRDQEESKKQLKSGLQATLIEQPPN